MNDNLVGMKLREYTILACIGSGGTAKVYKARHDLLEEFRAVKLLRPEFSDAEEFKARLSREARILVRLKHPHLVSMFEFGTLGQDVLFMVMEYLEGDTLRRRLQKTGWISVPRALEIAQQVALGLAAAHEQGIVHRDVSPDNVLLVSSEGSETVKVIDFGIAKNVVSAESKLTGTLKFVGKVEYCSPEQIMPQSPGEELDARTDIYSLGVTLYEILTGTRPFQAKTPMAIAAQHLNVAPRPFAEVNPLAAVPPAVEALVMRMMEKDRKRRPASMNLLVAELEALRREHAILSRTA